ncbi:hypothetical protein C0993_003850 [Termitomyces sp. T159_Od127]|nr:hypothetical protein C0993_003850 [Termitomyces sp. T159_Od127]
MAGKSIAEAQEAKRAQRKKADMQKDTPDRPTTSAKSFVAITGLDGKLWYIDPTQLGQLPSPPETTSFANIATSCEEPHFNQSTEYWEHIEFMVIVEACTTIDWNTHTKEITENILAVNVSPLTGTKHAPLTALGSTPFFVDSGATVHISPYHKDFISLQPIPP